MLLAIGLIGFLISWFGGEQKPSEPLMSEYGVSDLPGAPPSSSVTVRVGHPEDIPLESRSRIKLDGSRLMYLNPKKYRLMGVLYHLPPGIERIDVNGISKSSEFDIHGEQITIEIPWNQKFRAEVANVEKGSSYALLAIPVGVTPDQFDTLRAWKDRQKALRTV